MEDHMNNTLTLDAKGRLWCSCGDEITYKHHLTCEDCDIILCPSCTTQGLHDRVLFHLCMRRTATLFEQRSANELVSRYLGIEKEWLMNNQERSQKCERKKNVLTQPWPNPPSTGDFD